MDVRTIDSLPYDIILEIFQYLSFEDLVLSVQFVNQNWQNIVQESISWKNITFKPPYGSTTESVVMLLSKCPFLKSFEFREGLKEEDLFNALCKYNPMITSLSFGTFEADTPTIETLIQKFPNLEYLQLSLSVFVNHTSYLCKLKNLKKIKCIQLFHQYSVLEQRSGEIELKDGDWHSLEALDLYSEHSCETFHQMMSFVQGRLKSLEMQTLHSSLFLTHIPLCVQLQTLKLNFMARQFAEIDFGEFFTDLKNLINLKCLSLTSFVNEDADVISCMFLKSKFPKLVELNLANSSTVSLRVFKSISTACAQLSIICLKGCVVVDDACLKEIAQCSLLSNLDISGCPAVTDKGLSYLKNCLHLQELKMNWNGLITLPMLDEIAKMKSTKKLYLDSTEINSSVLVETLKQLPHLKFLSVCRTSGVDGEQVQGLLPNCFVQYCKKDKSETLRERCINVTHLVLQGPDKKVLKGLQHCRNLEDLSIDFMAKPCYSFISVIQDFKHFGKLHTLALKGFVVTKKGILGDLLAQKGLSQLRDLDLENCCSLELEDAQLIASEHPKLEKLRLKGCVGLKNEALSAFLRMGDLRLLDISGCTTLTETGLLSLQECKNLEELNLSGLSRETTLSDHVLNGVLSLPNLSKLSLSTHDSVDTFIKSKNWVIKEMAHGESVSVYVPSENAINP
ncbi:hypothetical protein R5R35_000803 [Gryllus longicercus]|uniref:F-box domain-containing protein n=1 Tax=Gryllus longicercus TaxID=2509291 RepID=A0AAN9ZBC0_9ORTH